MAKKREAIDPALLDELLAGRDPKTVLSSEGLLGELQKALAERILNGSFQQPRQMSSASNCLISKSLSIRH